MVFDTGAEGCPQGALPGAAVFSMDEAEHALNPLQHLPVVGMLYRQATGQTLPAPLSIMGSVATGAIFGGPIGIAGSIALNLALELFRLGPDTSRPAVPEGMEAAGAEAGVRTVSPGSTTQPGGYTSLATATPDFLGGGATQMAGPDSPTTPVHVALGAYVGAMIGYGLMLAWVGGDGFLRMGDGQWRCCHGRTGLRHHKQEGDGASPIGLLTLRRVLFRADRGPAPDTVTPLEPIGPEDGWCDDPADQRYNRAVRLPYAGRHEALWRDDGLYDIVGVLGWNDDPVVPGNGSAIFLHAARLDYAPTEGCVALAIRDLREILARGLSGVRLGPGEVHG